MLQLIREVFFTTIAGEITFLSKNFLTRTYAKVNQLVTSLEWVKWAETGHLEIEHDIGGLAQGRNNPEINAE